MWGKNGVEGIKCEGRSTVRRSGVILPAAAFLFLIDKGILTHTIFSLFIPSSSCLSSLLPLSVFACVMQRQGECGLFSPPGEAEKSGRYIMGVFACLFVCLAHIPTAYLSHFWRDVEASGVNGKLKQNVPVLHIAIQCSGDGRAEADWEVV